MVQFFSGYLLAVETVCCGLYLTRIDGWMTHKSFTSFSTIFQSYEDDRRLIIEGCVQWNTVYDWKDFSQWESNLRQ